MNYTTRADNTQKVYLCETPLDVVNILRTDYDYLYDAISDEGIILKGLECNLFKEIVFDSKVVGFCSYDFSSEFITAALNNIYVLPEFRGNGLFLAELQKTMVEYNKPSIIEPTRLVVELLVKYGFASKISDTLVASSLEFIVPGNHVQSNSDYQKEELSTHFYDLNICSSIHFLDIEKGIIAYSSPLNYDIIHYDCLNKRKSMDDGDYLKAIEYFDKALEISPQYRPPIFNKAKAYYYAGMYEDALRWFNKSKFSWKCIDNYVILSWIGDTLNELNRFDEAIEAYLEAIDIIKDTDIVRICRADSTRCDVHTAPQKEKVGIFHWQVGHKLTGQTSHNTQRGEKAAQSCEEDDRLQELCGHDVW